MSTTEFFSNYDTWAEERADIQRRDGDGIGIVSSSEWQNSDDAAFELLQQAVELLRQPVKVWTCALADDDRPDMHPLRVTVHATEDECFEHLRDKYDPEGMADDEPPVAIVSHLQDEGWVVDVDVHDIKRSA